MTQDIQKVTREHIDSLLDSAKLDYAVLNECEVAASYKLTARGGYTVFGRAATADPEEFDLKIGLEIVRGVAFKELWIREAYLLTLKKAGLIQTDII